MAVNFKTKKDTGPRINEQITASEVRLISSSGKQMGILSIREALIQAEDEGFDLVEVSPEANPPVCKIIDYGKLKYSIPEYIKNNDEVNQFIVSINDADKKEGGEGAIIIKLKSL